MTYPKAPRNTKHTIAGSNNIISAPIAPTNQCTEIELQDSIPEPTSMSLVAKPNRNNDNMRNGRQQGTSNHTSGVKYESPPSIALCGQNTECIMGCTNAPEQGPDGNIKASHNNCANAMTTMDGLQLLLLTDLGKEATGSLHDKLRQQNKWLWLLQQKLQKINTYWTKHKGVFFIPDDIPPLSMCCDEIRPKSCPAP